MTTDATTSTTTTTTPSTHEPDPAASDLRPWEPPTAGTETEHLLGALDRMRWTFRWKAGHLDAPGCGPASAPPL